ncbi:NAD(P)H-dependent glycerol-3-phosphate dehydrogenase [Catenovulum agarivorans DS-2]|uniref:Glycerol-3-phosphate dehydrogenase [NAD(P)+] n=1 Tax=Catenovulum agarivorans DS-2 TaxID=1328313 RepID=W7QFI6_9ALTE|nr:NAD(P)H-dependent glycerol-3-phosphate dehydrogenase [Catenovulum agarivorans]EWH10671.1 NAD(P)H-dependent glycerol-3-phosphate dehydrogenase [Catenovulum agarivorans DS-2]
MSEPLFDIGVIGAGSYGTALAICIARNGHKTALWGRDEAQISAMQQSRENSRYLPGLPLPPALSPQADLAHVVQNSRNILLVVPSHAFGEALAQIKPHLRDDSSLAWATKGLEPESGRLLQDVAREQLGESRTLAVVSGPTFAKEMAAGMPTAISVSSTDADFIQTLSDLMHCEKRFRVYKNNDFIGVQLGGAVKNVIAIGAGMADGIGFGANARTALITRGLTELCRLGEALGAKPETFMGMAGLGDLVLTCTDNQSRNRRFGLALGQGKSVEQAMSDIGQVVEGYRNTKEVYMLAQRMQVEMPIVDQIYQVLYQGKAPKEGALALLGREQKFE